MMKRLAKNIRNLKGLFGRSQDKLTPPREASSIQNTNVHLEPTAIIQEIFFLMIQQV